MKNKKLKTRKSDTTSITTRFRVRLFLVLATEGKKRYLQTHSLVEVSKIKLKDNVMVAKDGFKKVDYVT